MVVKPGYNPLRRLTTMVKRAIAMATTHLPWLWVSLPRAIYIYICIYMGVDQKVLARRYVFGDHSSLFKSLRERSAMEFAKETFFFFRERFRVGFLEASCALAYFRPRSLVDREMRSTY